MTEKYQILARRYRPQNFKEVVGQEAIVTTIKNAIRLNKSAHAYLFSGSRGIGKTTLARLFAKALNCQNLSDDFEPCDECSSCLEIASSRSLDVIEIDGASNRGIDDIRHINETIGYAPSSGKYKIYIIDEVHMLTKEAFNALLKTLEEPPPMIKFFFATTEAHKVLPTIISRCQRFDLVRIPHALLVDKLRSILLDLNRSADEEALHLIANFSEGSLRDGESLLDQLLCFEEGNISVEIVSKTLGFIPQNYFFMLDEAIEKNNISFAFEFMQMLLQGGKDLSHFLDELSQHFRTHLLMKMKGKVDYLPLNLQKEYEKTSIFFSQDQLLHLLDLIVQNMNKSSSKRIHIESLLLQIIRSKSRIPIASLVYRLMELEKKLASKPTLPPNNHVEVEKPSLPKPEIKPMPEEKAEEKPEMEKIPFNLNPEVEKTPLKKEAPLKSQSHYDTLMRFAAVELEGRIVKED